MKLNLYVWKNFCNGGYSDGMAFAIAASLEQAVEMVDQKIEWDKRCDRKQWGDVEILSVSDPVSCAMEGCS